MTLRVSSLFQEELEKKDVDEITEEEVYTDSSAFLKVRESASAHTHTHTHIHTYTHTHSDLHTASSAVLKEMRTHT